MRVHREATEAVGWFSIRSLGVAQSFVVTVMRRSYCSILAVSGELDVAATPDMRAALAECAGDIYVDCRDLTFLDAAGIGVFVAAHERCRARGDRFVLYGLSGICHRVLELIGLTDHLELEGAHPSPLYDKRVRLRAAVLQSARSMHPTNGLGSSAGAARWPLGA